MENYKPNKIADHESESEEEIFWDSLSQLEDDIETVKDQKSETEIDIFWDSLSQLEDNIEIVMDQKSETEVDIFWDSSSQLEGEHETIESMNRDTPEMSMNNEENEFNNESFKRVWDKIYRNETFKDVPNLSKESKIRKVRSRKEFISKFILFFVIIGQVAIAKEIGGMVYK